MRTLAKALLVLAMAVAPGAALAQEYEAEDYGVDAQPPPDAQPTVAAPEQLPPPPATAAAPVQQLPAGQWTYTAQYGWIWQPYDQAYTYVPADGTYPMVYAYYPSYGWHWLTAPWVYSVGPRPHWGVYGFTRYAWHSRPWFRVPSHYGHYRGGYGQHYRHAPAVGFGHDYRREPARGYGGGGHGSWGWNGGGNHRGGGEGRGGGAGNHQYRPQGGGNHGGSGHQSPGAGNGGRPGGGGRSGGTHSARPASRR
ncbi:MAG TPA: hypothetical protein VGK67_11980 [Myxococcales bacterium]|jgi:uncharacterized membrane protein YgcG